MTQVAEVQERETQKAYWKEHSGEATVEAMMLDSHAAEIDKLERPEVGPGPRRRVLGGLAGAVEARSMRSMRLHVQLAGRPAAPSRHQRISPADRALPVPPPSLQVLKLLGSVEGLRLVELGAGIGRCGDCRRRRQRRRRQQCPQRPAWRPAGAALARLCSGLCTTLPCP